MDLTANVVDIVSESFRGKDHQFYRIKLARASDRREWEVKKRYRELEALSADLKNRNIPLKTKVPPKVPLFGNIGSNNAQKRLGAIKEFINEIFSSNVAVTSYPVLRFFEINENSSTNSIQKGKDVKLKSDNEETKALEPPSMVNIGTTQEEHIKPSDFEFLKTIGKGSYGKVFMARHKAEDKIYAIKVLTKSHIRQRNEVQHVMAERNVMVRVIHHPFIVRIEHSFQTFDKLYFVVEFVNGGELFFHLQKEQTFSEPRVRFYSAEIVSAIGYLHANGIIYRDLKPENILLDSQGHVKLTDFGLCKEGLGENDEKTSTFCGTPEYLAPEIIKKQAYTKAVDWWCTGAVVYEMLQGIPPFYNRNSKIMHDDIVKKPLVFKRVISEAAKDIINKLLRKDGTKRLGSGKEDAAEIKRHPFYREIDWEALDLREIKPPLAYLTTDKTDLRFIDPEFVREPIPASVQTSQLMNLNDPAQQDSAFMGFTFVNKPNLAEDVDDDVGGDED